MAYPGECPELTSSCIRDRPANGYQNETEKEICSKTPCASCKSVSLSFLTTCFSSRSYLKVYMLEANKTKNISDHLFLDNWQSPLIFVRFSSNFLAEHMREKFELNRTKIKGACQSYTKAAPQESCSDFTLAPNSITIHLCLFIEGSQKLFALAKKSAIVVQSL